MEMSIDEEDLKSKTNKIRDLIVDMSKNSSSHGWPKIFEARNVYIKIMWGIFLLLSTWFCSYLLIRAIIEYQSNEVVTKTRLIQQAPIDFPVVTICNLNPLVTPAARQFILEHFNKLRPEGFTNLDQMIEYFSGADGLSRMYYEMEVLRQKAAYTSDEIKKTFGYEFKELIVKCQFNNKKCEENDFDWFYNPIYGNCFRFNNKIPMRKAFYAGEAYGLKLDLYVGLQENNLFSYQSSSGIRLFIQNQSIVPLFNEGLSIQTGKTSLIKLNKVITENVPNPYSDCQEFNTYDSILAKNILESGKSFRFKYCMTLCLQMLVIDECSCYSLEEPYLPTSRKPCFLDRTQYACYVNMYRQFSDVQKNTNCTRECPLECKSENYQLETSVADFPSKAYSKEVLKDFNVRRVFKKYDGIEGQELSFENVKQGMLSANIYFEELKYTEITEEVKTTAVDLVANLGGTLGLFIGVSLLSFGEIIEFLIEAYYIIRKD